MKRLLVLTAAFEAVTGLVLLIAPAVVARLLLNADLPPVGAAVGRVAACALLALAIACWPGRNATSTLISAARAMLTYNTLVACYLVFLGIGGQFAGPLLWPAVAIHGLLILLFLCTWPRTGQTPDAKA